jgi:putative phosphoribosyl transferase
LRRHLASYLALCPFPSDNSVHQKALYPCEGHALDLGVALRFRDRFHAGQVLAERLQDLRGDPELLVLALPRGGVPVAFGVATRLHAPLDVFVVRKLGVPGHEELAMGAVASGGIRVIDTATVQALGISPDEIEAVTQRELSELERQERAFRAGRPAPKVEGKTVVLVDDGLATGATMRAAALALRSKNVGRLIVAVPVASVQACEEFQNQVNRVVCLLTPEPFHAVGLWYEDFSPVSDQEVRNLLERANAEVRSAA